MTESACQCAKAEGPDRRYCGLPVAFMAYGIPAPFLMTRGEVISFLRLNESKTRFPAKALQRYRGMGLKTVRVGRCVFYRLDDVLRFLDAQQDREAGQAADNEKTS